MTNREIELVFEQGYEAAQRLFDARDCPYPDGTPSYDHWHNGYFSANRDMYYGAFTDE